MSEPNYTLINRIEERLRVLGLSDRKASMNATGKPDLIRDLRRGKRIEFERMGQLASALETTLDYLYGKTDSAAIGASEPGAPRMPDPSEMPRDIPVYGTALGASREIVAGDGIAIEQTDLNTGEVIDYYRRPPALRDRRDVYVLYIAGDSMEPAFESGQGILVEPRTPRLRDYVVVYRRAANDDDGASAVLIKRLVRRTSEYIELQQYNPPSTFQLPMRQVAAVHRVKPWDEAVGV